MSMTITVMRSSAVGMLDGMLQLRHAGDPLGGTANRCGVGSDVDRHEVAPGVRKSARRLSNEAQLWFCNRSITANPCCETR